MVVKPQYLSGWFLIINSLLLFVVTSVGLGIDYEQLRLSLVQYRDVGTLRGCSGFTPTNSFRSPLCLVDVPIRA